MAQPGCSQHRLDGEVKASLKCELHRGWQTVALLPAGSGQEPSASPLSLLSDAMCSFIPHAASILGTSHCTILSNNGPDLLTHRETGGFRVQNVSLSLWHPNPNSALRAGAHFYIPRYIMDCLALDLNKHTFSENLVSLTIKLWDKKLASQSVMWIFDLTSNI